MGKQRLPFISGDEVAGPVSEQQTNITLAELKDASGKIEQIDLHGEDSISAEFKTRQFLDGLIYKKEKFGRIIFGIGTGALKKVVKQVILEYQKQGLVEAFIDPKRPELAGAAVVVIMG